MSRALQGCEIHGAADNGFFLNLGRFSDKGPRMAKFYPLLFVALFAAAGCQQQSQVSLVDNLPSPNFGGPTFAPPPAPTPPPAVAVAQPKPKPKAIVPVEPPVEATPVGWAPNVPANHWYWIVLHHS